MGKCTFKFCLELSETRGVISSLELKSLRKGTGTNLYRSPFSECFAGFLTPKYALICQMTIKQFPWFYFITN